MVEIDLAKFFDTVNHDRLMSTLARRIDDKALLKLIRRYLKAGIMADGLVSAREEGVQGGNLSPLLSLIVLDELDKRAASFALRNANILGPLSLEQLGNLEHMLKVLKG